MSFHEESRRLYRSGDREVVTADEEEFDYAFIVLKRSYKGSTRCIKIGPRSVR